MTSCGVPALLHVAPPLPARGTTWRRDSASFRRRNLKARRQLRSGAEGRGKAVRNRVGRRARGRRSSGRAVTSHWLVSLRRSSHRSQEGARRAAAKAEEGERSATVVTRNGSGRTGLPVPSLCPPLFGGSRPALSFWGVQMCVKDSQPVASGFVFILYVH